MDNNESAIKKEQPYNEMAEQSVIGSMLLDRDVIGDVADLLTKEDFYNNRYGVLYENMVELATEGKPVDLITLSDKLRSKNVPDIVSSPEYIREIVMSVPTSANAKQYATIVKDKSTLRHFIKITEGLASQAYAKQDNVDGIIEEAERNMMDIARSRNSATDFEPVEEIVLRVLEQIDVASKTHGRVTGLPTGFLDLDNALTGLQPSQLVLVAARPAMGKTAFVLNIAHYVTTKKNVPTAIFSLEMPNDQLIKRFLSMDSMVNSGSISTGNLQGTELEMVLDSADNIVKTKLYIDDSSSLTLGALRTKCRKLKQNHDIGLVVIDYLQLMEGNPRTDSRQQQVAELSRGLKNLARELHIPIIALSQLSRAADARPDHRPVLSDLRESGSIEQDADIVMFLYREGYYRSDEPIDEEEQKRRERSAEVIIAKNRAGATGTIPLTWLGEYTKFQNAER